MEVYISMAAEEKLSSEGVINHTNNAFSQTNHQVDKFYSQVQKNRKTKDAFASNLQLQAGKIIVYDPAFNMKANQQLKHQSNIISLRCNNTDEVYNYILLTAYVSGMNESMVCYILLSIYTIDTRGTWSMHTI